MIDIYKFLFKLGAIKEATLNKKLYLKRINTALARIADLEEKIRLVKLNKRPRALKVSNIDDEIKFIRGLVEANRAMVKILMYKTEGL